MAAGDTGVFDSFLVDLADKKHNVNSDTFNFGLVDNTTTPVASLAAPHWAGTGTTNFFTNQVGTGGGYTGPIALAGAAFTDEGDNSWKLDFNDPSTISKNASAATDIYWMIIYNATSAAKECVGWMELGGPVSLVAYSLTITFGAGGFFTIT